MKITTKLLPLATMIAAGMVTTTAHAVSYTAGDLLLGFRATGGTGANTDYVIDLGSASTFRDATSSFSIGSFGTDLSAIYGAGWATRSDLLWSVIGGGLSGDGTNTVYASAAETVFGTHANPLTRFSNSAQAGVVTKISNTAGVSTGGYLGGSTSFNSNPLSNGSAVAEDQTAANPWAQYQFGFGSPANTSAFGLYASPGIEGSFANGAAVSALDLYRMATSTTAGLPGTYVGTFTINTSGQGTFNVVPEPSSALMLGLGTAFLGFVRRRRQAALS